VDHAGQMWRDRVATLGASRCKILNKAWLAVQSLAVLVRQRLLHLDQLDGASVTLEAVLMIVVIRIGHALFLDNLSTPETLGSV
jgi:hypothetical protein